MVESIIVQLHLILNIRHTNNVVLVYTKLSAQDKVIFYSWQQQHTVCVCVCVCVYNLWGEQYAVRSKEMVDYVVMVEVGQGVQDLSS